MSISLICVGGAIKGIHLGASPEPCSAASGGVLNPKGIKKNSLPVLMNWSGVL